jgi:hypothetical protein
LIAKGSAFAFLASLMAKAGRLFKGDYLADFFIEPSWFDAEDITAMRLPVHKSILRALDASGIDISKQRLRQTFKGVWRGEEL